MGLGTEATTLMKENKYKIDNEPASAEDIISKAKEYDEEFERSGFYQTSVAAGILRKNGHTVENNENYIN